VTDVAGWTIGWNNFSSDGTMGPSNGARCQAAAAAICCPSR
jgi:hypothetical protein